MRVQLSGFIKHTIGEESGQGYFRPLRTMREILPEPNKMYVPPPPHRVRPNIAMGPIGAGVPVGHMRPIQPRLPGHVAMAPPAGHGIHSIMGLPQGGPHRPRR